MHIRASPLAHPSANQGDAHLSQRCVHKEFTGHPYRKNMQQRSGAVLAEAPPTDSAMQATGSCATLLAGREEWLLAKRIAASKGFCKSELLQRFLLGISALTLSGRADEITEQRIGVCIFSRPEGYDPGQDNIVRSYARTMRKRLDTYFSDEGEAELLRLDVPRGGYVPVFSAAPHTKKPVVAAKPVQAQKLDATDAHSTRPRMPRSRALHTAWLWIAAGILAALLLWTSLCVFYTHTHRSSAHALWVQLFEHDRPTLIVPADSGLGIIENLTHTEATLDTYASGSYFASLHLPDNLDARGIADASSQHYTSIVDLNLCTAIERLPEFEPDHVRVHFARNLTVDEMRTANVILLGSVHSNPWVALFEPGLNFQFVYTPEVDRSLIVNRHPRAGEQGQYKNGAPDGHGFTYGTLAYLPDAGSARHVLLIQGLNMAGTQAAASVLFNAAAMQPVLRAASTPSGQLRAFEVLVEAATVDSSAPEAHVIATRIAPQS